MYQNDDRIQTHILVYDNLIFSADLLIIFVIYSSLIIFKNKM